jgi:hypothetical protein
MFGKAKKLQDEIALLRSQLAAKELELATERDARAHFEQAAASAGSQTESHDGFNQGLYQRLFSFSQSMADCQASLAGLAGSMKKEAEIIDATALRANSNTSSVHKVTEDV